MVEIKIITPEIWDLKRNAPLIIIRITYRNRLDKIKKYNRIYRDEESAIKIEEFELDKKKIHQNKKTINQGIYY